MPPRPTDSPSLAKTALTLARHVNDMISAGDRADLRRMRPSEVGPPAFWRLIAGPLAPALGSRGRRRDEQERQWALVVTAMARSGMPHDGARGLGGGLAAAGVSELRFMKLLRADPERLSAQVLSVAQLMASKAEPVNWIDLAHLVLSGGRGDSEDCRRRIARDYFAAID